MKAVKYIILSSLLLFLSISSVLAQRAGNMDNGLITDTILIADGPKGPIKGGESAVTDMMLMGDGFVYGSTEAVWGASSCHIFHTCSKGIGHELNVTEKIPGQTKVKDIEKGPGGIIFGVTSTYDEVFDGKKKDYDGGHIFSFDPATKKVIDYGVISSGNGLNCVAVDTLHSRIYTVSYPGGHLFSYNYATKEKKDFGEIMKPWRVKDLGKVSWRGVPKVLMLDDAGTLYFSSYITDESGNRKGGRIYRLASGDDKPVFTGALIPTQKGMDDDPIYENTIVSAVKAKDGGFWCGSSVDGFLFKFEPSTSTVLNKGKGFNYWNLRSLAYGGDGKLYMLGGRDYDNSWFMSYDPSTASFDCIGWPSNTNQCAVICADRNGKILLGENLRNSYLLVYGKSSIKEDGGICKKEDK